MLAPVSVDPLFVTEARQRIYNSVEPAPALHVVGDDAQRFRSHLCATRRWRQRARLTQCSTEAANVFKRAMRSVILQPQRNQAAPRRCQD